MVKKQNIYVNVTLLKIFVCVCVCVCVCVHECVCSFSQVSFLLEFVIQIFGQA